MTKINIQSAIIIGALMISGAIIYTKPPQSVVETPQKLGTAQVISPESKTEIIITEKDHIRGNPKALVTIVEFSDFQCPFCKRFHPTVQQILENYSDQVRWVYKHFPLDEIHSEARPSAEASECVFEQKGNDGFWQFADRLFENQSRLGNNLYTELASELSLNMSQFNDCLSSRKYKDHVEANYQEGINLGVRGTPGNFVNGQAVSGAVPYETLKAAVDKALDNLN